MTQLQVSVAFRPAGGLTSRVVRLVLFDIDGTLIRTGGAGVKAFGRAFATEFNIPDGAERLRFSGRTDTGLAREFFLQHQIEPTLENFRRFFDAYVFWLDYMLTQTRGVVIDGVWEFIGQLRSLPLPPALGLLTGNIRLGAEIKLRHYELWELFQTGAFADDAEDRNQLAALARERGSRLLNDHLRGGQILVIGDTPRDVECARAIDARMLAVTTGGAEWEDLEPHRPDLLVRDLTQVTARDVCS
ncbi:MAG: hydrolase [Verrucomicrobia bacterium]|nr:MAG: hydrolase [Verrucomicrobiota bacterium]